MNVISTRHPPCIAAPAVQQGVHCAANRSGKCFRRFSIRRSINYRYARTVFIVPSLAKSRRSPCHAEISTPRNNNHLVFLSPLRNYRKKSIFAGGEEFESNRKSWLPCRPFDQQLYRRKSLIRGACERRIRPSRGKPRAVTRPGREIADPWRTGN